MENIAEVFIDEDLLTELYGKDQRYVQEMSSVFLTVVDQDMAQLERLVSSEDYTNLAAELHKIKANYSMVGLPMILDTCVELEKEALNSPNEKSIEEKFKVLKSQVKIGVKLLQEREQ